MPASPIESRLQQLESILGQMVFLADEEENPECLPKDEVATCVVVQKEKEEGKPRSSTEASSLVGVTLPGDAPPATSEVDSDEYLIEMARFRDLKPQDLSDEDLRFCPWKVVKSYADAYTGKGNRERACNPISPWDRTSRLVFVRIHFPSTRKPSLINYALDELTASSRSFYIRDTHEPRKTHLLVPTTGVEHLLRYINNRLDTALRVPHGAARHTFALRFSGCGPFRPRFLMHHRPQQRGAGDGVFNIEDPSTWPRDDDVEGGVSSLAGEAAARLNANMTLLRRDPCKGTVKVSAAERAEKRKERRRKEMRAMHSYLGLKDGVVEEVPPSNVVLFCVDVEAIEVPPGPVSEIGIAILDMRSVGEQSPGNRGRDWWPLIEGHHLRIKEYKSLTNYRYVRGCPEDFQFGCVQKENTNPPTLSSTNTPKRSQSTFPSRSDACEAVRSILRPYVDAGRRIVLAGHDVEQDVNYLRDGVGVDVRGEYAAALAGTVDSQTLCQAWMATDTARSLGALLGELGFEHAYLHNAGNDAMHTLRAAIGAAFADAEPADSPE
ncbi:hypothetical protein ISF_00838 [Cordyceps fumosorosea ARSEF 2679]|uniref:Gfd2/YDR514C-like C-terminal domain-containing protein n=1 Tax=Cordyceps fumosorosea (strain ARSEF 2679) TaxID=1081104 RepID=A0A168EL49_CORFA|nr:hypothetical protein ISF_00838 [Cordyceps fumosorosea ARSEF 2679]OAA73937.1 hypothetical protein ISF_00838 [Cordyceps fumosorosea ARSEF 2679]